MSLNNMAQYENTQKMLSKLFKPSFQFIKFLAVGKSGTLRYLAAVFNCR